MRERKRNLLYLIRNYLKEQNLQETADVLCNEAQLTNQFDVCDNVDLDIIYQDYESFYFTKFNKTPKILKKNTSPDSIKYEIQTANRRKPKIGLSHTSLIPPSSNSSKQFYEQQQTNYPEFQIDVTSLSNNTKQYEDDGVPTKLAVGGDNICCNSDGGYVKQQPLCNFDGYTSEWREIADQILKEIVPKNLGVKWSDCIGRDAALEMLKEAAVYPFEYPELFNGLITPWRGKLLLFLFLIVNNRAAFFLKKRVNKTTNGVRFSTFCPSFLLISLYFYINFYLLFIIYFHFKDVSEKEFSSSFKQE